MHYKGLLSNRRVHNSESQSKNKRYILHTIYRTFNKSFLWYNNTTLGKVWKYLKYVKYRRP